MDVVIICFCLWILKDELKCLINVHLLTLPQFVKMENAYGENFRG